MRFLTMITTLIITSIIMIGCRPGGDVSIKSEEDKAFYSMGAMFGSRLANLNLTDREIGAIAKGLRVTAKGEKAEIEIMKYQRKIQEMIRGRIKKLADGAKETGKKYLESFLKKEDGKKTGSGLAYKIVTDGKGELPKSEDTVEVHYHGTLIDGTVFDSSKDRGKTVSFPLNRVIKGWKEGLQLIREGGKIKLVIPSDLGYGDQGAPPKIPGGSTLLFDVELIKIKSKTEIEKERKMQFSKFKDKSKIEALTKKIKAKQLKKK